MGVYICVGVGWRVHACVCIGMCGLRVFACVCAMSGKGEYYSGAVNGSNGRA